MFDFGIGYTELLVIAVVAIIVIGPKDLPRVLRALGRMTAKLRGMAREFQGHLDAAMRETGFEDVKRDLQSIKSINPVADVAQDFRKQDDDFKKYFSDIGEKPAEPAKTADAAESKTEAKAADDNDFDKYFGKAKVDSTHS
jgi:sec-independent protein translocase protein TatB